MFAPTERVCYVLCPFCNTDLAVEVPYRPMETAMVKCGHCNIVSNLSFFTPIAPVLQYLLPPDHHISQGSCRRNQPLPLQLQLLPPASSASYEQTSPKTPFVVKPPEKKSRPPSNYNRFVRDEIKRIKAAKPDIAHREAFSRAAKNWARPSNDHDSLSTGSSSVTMERGN